MSRASRSFRLVAAAALAAALVVPVASVAAVSPPAPVAAHVTMQLPTVPAVCGKEWPAFVRVTDAAGVAIAGKTVEWGMAPVVSSQDGITAAESVTDANGIATTNLAIDCIPGSRTLMAMADDAQGQAVVPISAVGMAAGEMPPPAPSVKAARLILSVPPGPLPCGVRSDVALRVLADDGGTIAGAMVVWSLDPFGSVGDIWGANETWTGSQGETGNAVWPTCGAAGKRILNARVDGVSVAYALEVDPVAAAEASLEPTSAPMMTPPPTSTGVGDDSTGQLGGAALLGLVLLVLGAARITAVHSHRARRS